VKPKFNSIKFSKDYLLQEKIVSTNLKKWIKSKNIKTLAIKSTYNTGKTTMIKHILEKYGVKRVLFVSYRKTLTSNLFFVFKKYYQPGNNQKQDEEQ